MIFGTLLTSSNYNDSERKVTGGRNGYGAKLCNIFSSRFTVETQSNAQKKRFKQVRSSQKRLLTFKIYLQTWVKNMTKEGEPEIEPISSGEDFTKVTFSPDLKRFKMKELDDDIIALMSRRAYDIAGAVKDVKVFLNDHLLPVSLWMKKSRHPNSSLR